ncbi:MAG: dihydrofolate reductase family protein [Myxococcales bacterium]|nr:dihydrofolate reductase family protein [Myxococcales bacterium]
MPSSAVRVYLGCSLDGCIAGPDHDLSFLESVGPVPEDERGDALTFELFLESVGALLMGRRTYQVLLDYGVWPYGDRPVLVATHHPLPDAPGGGDARRVEGDIATLVAAARAAAGDRAVYVDGGDVVRQALDADLVDDLCLTILPIVVGRGIRLWDGLLHRRDLEFDAPVRYGPHMVQLRARVRR